MSNHSFDIHIAAEYKSVEIAILIWHFHYWIMKNKRLGRNLHDGRTWTYQTIPEISAAFPYWSADQVKRLLQKAIRLKVLVKGNYNKSVIDRTNWYAFANEEKFGISQFREMEDFSEENKKMFTKRRNRPLDGAKSPDGWGEIARSIPDTLPNTLTKKEESEPAAGLITSFFAEKVQALNPKIQKPNLAKWEKEMELCMARDKRTEGELKQVIEYIEEQHKNTTSGFTWSQVVMSPQKLRKHFATIWLEMTKKKNKPGKEDTSDEKVERLKENKEWLNKEIITKVKEKIEKLVDEGVNIRLISETEVYLKEPRSFSFVDCGDKGFREVVTKFLKKWKLLE